VTGTIEKGESPKEAIIREAEEEIGIKLEEVSLVTTIFLIEKDYFDPLKKFYALELFFVCNLGANQNPINMEPLKQDAMDWFEPDNLPTPMIPGVAFGLRSYFNNLNYAEFCNV
jgi:8-oxo-dGTP pyrophosphatase MutT (NUDIX family)